ncbi:uncharacterized protein IL334_002739 [Kwoniella shivajii]|uniref:Uncharacterized protein n=1 Tax=Kwoniella shivajii TaxID=564305 RepID=A0ABZ1CVX1_9TREE|nr:hypothetical protein IL334_002739 [Kwoniella shivajii]
MEKSNTRPLQPFQGERKSSHGSIQKGQADAKGKGKGQPKPDNLPIIPQKDLFQRINFSYQAAIFLQNLGSNNVASNSSSGLASSTIINVSPPDGEVGMKVDRKGKRKAIEYTQSDQHGNRRKAERGDGVAEEEEAGVTKKRFRQLARMNMREMNGMSVHNQLKLDPSLKRSLCKTCGTILIPGLTSRIRNRPNRNSFSITHHHCLTCHSSLSIPAPPIPSTSLDDRSAAADDGLDGPLRRARRRKASKRGKRIFHEREGDAGGHVLWKGEQKLEGWGVKV